MTIEQEILSEQVKIGALDHHATARGIALLAIDKGFGALTNRQQAVLRPFLSASCEGFTEPGEHHNNCQRTVEGEDYVTALMLNGFFGGPLCEDCRNESDDYDARWERIEAE